MRGRPVRREPSQAAAVSCEQPVAGVEYAVRHEPEDPSRGPRAAQHREQLREAGAAAGQRAVRPHEPPAGEALALGKLVEKSGGGRILEGQERERLVRVEPGREARREAAAAALRVVEQDRAGQLPALEALEQRQDERAQRVEVVAALLHEHGRQPERAEEATGLAEASLRHLQR